MEEVKKEFCIYCRKETEYSIKKCPVHKVIRDKEYDFLITKYICNVCGEEMSPLGMSDKNNEEIDAQYREAEDIISVDSINRLMEIYNIGKAPLALALGFGEITITRYLSGQIPSKEYSDLMKRVEKSAALMRKYMDTNRNKVGETAYRKTIKAIEKNEQMLGTVSRELLTVISYIFAHLKEVTPLTLQKLLYYIQGIYYTKYDKLIFPEKCEAWVHGPVYRNVYELFKNFQYSPIEDARFSLVEGMAQEINNNEKEIIDLVLETFGIFSGKVLEEITHEELPWLNARKGYLDNEPSSEIISIQSIKDYFCSLNDRFDIFHKNGLNEYINYRLGRE